MQSSPHSSQHGDIPLIRWAIRARTIRTLLSSGHNPKDDTPPISTAHFGGAVPLLFTDRRTARAVWIKWLLHHGHIERKVTLPGQPVSYDVIKPMPEVDMVTVHLAHQALVPFFLNKEQDDD